jgi:hypothetical protein
MAVHAGIGTDRFRCATPCRLDRSPRSYIAGLRSNCTRLITSPIVTASLYTGITTEIAVSISVAPMLYWQRKYCAAGKLAITKMSHLTIPRSVFHDDPSQAHHHLLVKAHKSNACSTHVPTIQS